MKNDKLILININNKKSRLETIFVYHVYDKQIRQFISNKFLNNKLFLDYEKTNIKDINFLINNLNIKNLITVEKLKTNLILNFDKQKNIKDTLINKRVIIVGPADYVDSNDIINSYDIVVRINKGLSQQSNGKNGDRTDILYHVVNQHKENGGPLNPLFNGHTRFIYPILDYDEETTFKNIGTLRDYFEIFYDKNIYNSISKNFSIIDKNNYIQMEKKMNSRPNSGVGAILDLLSFDIKEIYITGFTLFQTNYSTDYRKNVDNIQGNTCKLALARMKKSGHHNQEKTALVFKNNILTDKRVKYDKILDQCINSIIL